MARITTFGELMLRLRAPGHLRFAQCTDLEATFGGGEANVAVGLAALGHDACWVSAVPANPIGDWALAELRKLGVDVSAVLRRGQRLGIYFLEMGASQRASQVVYDRTGAAVTELGAGDVDWPQILLESAWFHTTGITPALSRTVADATREALGAARRLGIPRSIDLNYRRKLWSPAAAQEVMTPLVAEADVLIANEEDAEQVFGIRAGRTDVASGTLDRDRYLDVAGELFAQFPELKVVAITLRESHDAGRNGWSALVAERESHAFARHYELSIVDRVGAGDAFAAGLIHARLSGMDISRTVEFATAAAALKHTIVGDFNRATAAEILALVEGGGSGRVAR